MTISKEEFERFCKNQEKWHENHQSQLSKIEQRQIDDARIVHVRINSVHKELGSRISTVEKESSKVSGKIVVIMGLLTAVGTSIAEFIRSLIQGGGPQ